MGRSDFAASFDQIATQLLAELYTHEVTFRRSTFTRANPWEAPTAEVSADQVNVKAAVLGPGTQRFNGELVEQDQRVVYVDRASLTTALDTETMIVIDGEEHPVISFVGYPEGALASAWEIFVRIN